MSERPARRAAATRRRALQRAMREAVAGVQVRPEVVRLVCRCCGMGINPEDPWLHLERYGHEPDPQREGK